MAIWIVLLLVAVAVLVLWKNLKPKQQPPVRFFGEEQVADISDFSFASESDPISFKDLVEDKEVFLYQLQRTHASRVWLIPFQEFCDVLEEKLKMLAVVGGVCSLAEPDIYSALALHHAIEPDKMPSALVGRIARASTLMLARPELKEDCGKVAIKTRSFVVRIADTLQAAMPATKSVFLYRNAVDTIDSFCVAFFNSAPNRIMRRLGLDSLVLFRLSPLPPLFPALVPLTGDPRFPRHTYEPLGAIGLTAMGWLSAMDVALALQARGVFSALLRYEDLLVRRFELVRALLLSCGYSYRAIDEALMWQKAAEAVMETDAHSNARTASARRRTGSKGPLLVGEREAAAVMELLALHGALPADIVLPGTLRA